MKKFIIGAGFQKKKSDMELRIQQSDKNDNKNNVELEASLAL